MPGQAPVLDKEAELLLAYVAQQRDGLRYAAFGLTDEQARSTPTPSSLSIGGLIKHATDMERGWMGMVLQRDDMADANAYADHFRMAPGESIDELVDELVTVGNMTEELVRLIADLDTKVPVPKGVPWFPADLDAWTLRWVLLHLVEELARHAGHADIIREAIDGATMHPLMAAVEGWPETDWLKPWRPAGTAAA